MRCVLADQLRDAERPGRKLRITRLVYNRAVGRRSDTSRSGATAEQTVLADIWATQLPFRARGAIDHARGVVRVGVSSTELRIGSDLAIAWSPRSPNLLAVGLAWDRDRVVLVDTSKPEGS